MAELTLREAAQRVGVSRQTIYRMVKEGKLTVTLRPDPTRRKRGSPKGEGEGEGFLKVVDTTELLRVFGKLATEADTVALDGVVRQPELVTRQSTGLPKTTPATARP